MKPSASTSTSPAPAMAGTKRPPVSQPASPQRVLVSLERHQWYVHKLIENQVTPCCICQEKLGCHSLCAKIAHRVCRECQHQLLQNEDPECPLCRRPLRSPAIRSAVDSCLEETRHDLQIDCAECDNWSGALDAIGTHIPLCGQRDHHCVYADNGCQWTGLLENKQTHEQHCDWFPVHCSHSGCQETVFRATQDAHEASCGYRPASLGALVDTNARTLQQLDNLRQFYQQDASNLAGQAPVELRTRVLETVTLFPLLYDAVEAGIPARLEQTCPWDCGFRASREQLDNHYPHCPQFPLSCEFCSLQVARSRLVAHMESCEDKTVTCPQSCGQEGLRIRDLASGAHQRSCSSRELACGWCMNIHPPVSFQQISLHCRFNLPDTPIIDNEPLNLAPNACGAVYVKERDTEGPVYIRLPAAILQRELGPLSTGRNLTQGLSFLWQGLSCELQVSYSAARRCFCVRMATTAGSFPSGQAVWAALYDSNGLLLETVKGQGADDSDICLLLQDNESSEARITGINRITGSDGDAFFLQLGPQFEV